MYRYAFDLLKKILGISLIIIGIISGFIPIIQGWLLIIAGLLLLGIKKETIKKLADETGNWFKKLRF